MEKYHGLGGLHNRNEFPYSSGGWKCEAKVPAGLISPKASPWLAGTVFSLCLPSVCVCVLTYSSDKDPSHMGWRPTLRTSL